MALVPYLDESDLTASDQDLLARPINLFRALANSPDGLRNFAVLPEWIRHGCQLDPRIRELVTLHIGYLTRSKYEFSHHVGIGFEFGVSEEDIRDLISAARGEPNSLGEIETLALAAAGQITLEGRMQEATFRALESHLGRARTIDLLIVAAFYNAVVRVLGTLQIDVEPEYAGYLEAFPLPSA